MTQPKLSDWSMPDDEPVRNRTSSSKSTGSALHPDHITAVVIHPPEQQRQAEEEDDSDNPRDDKYLFLRISFIDLGLIIDLKFSLTDWDFSGNVVNVVRARQNSSKH